MKRLLFGVVAIVCAGVSAPAHAANGLDATRDGRGIVVLGASS